MARADRPSGRHTRCVVLLAALLATVSGAAAAQGPAGFNSTQPTPRVEYWQRRLNEIETRLSAPESLAPVRLVFIGDSITDFWTLGDNPWFPGATGGRAVWAETFGGADHRRLGLNLGISGDRSEHLLYRILPRSEGGLGQLDRPDLDPDVIILMIGINNSWDAETPAVESIVDGVKAVVAAIHDRKPEAVIVLQSLLPTHEPERNQQIVMPVNQALQRFATEGPQAGYMSYLDLYPDFLGADGAQDRILFMDGVHPNEQGYRSWRDRLEPLLAGLDAKAGAPRR